MSSNVHIVQNQKINPSLQKTPLRSGTVVNARVVSHNGGSSYTLSVAGQKINVRSDVELKPGSVFKAQISVTGGNVSLKILGGQPANLVSFNNSSFDSSNSLINSMLANLGLPVTAESFKLVQFALSMGIKPEPSKLFRAGVRGGENKKEFLKEKIALLFEEKGLKVGGDALEKIVRQFEGEKENPQGKNHSEQNENGQKGREQKKGQKENPPEEAESITEDDVRAYFDELTERSDAGRAGSLTLFNSVLPEKKDEKHWLVLPFEWNFRDFDGVIRVLLSEDKKIIHKVIINCKNPVKSYLFVLYFRSNKIQTVKFCTENAVSDGSLQTVRQLIQDQFAGCKVEISDFSETDWFDSENLELGVFDGGA